MDVSSGDAFAAPLPEFDFELGSLDGLEFMDLDLLDEFWDGGVESFLAVPGKEGGLGLGDTVAPGGGRESSPDSAVTDDGVPSSEPSSGDRSEMSAYVSELERFLMEDGDGYEDREPTAPADEKVAAAADGYYFDDLFVAEEDCYPAPADAVTPGAGAGAGPEEEELAVDEYFFDDLYVADDGRAEPAIGNGIDDAEPTEEVAGDEYFFDDFSVADDGRAEPAAGVVDPASPDADEEEEDDDFAALEDEATSRKRARYE